MSETRQKNFQQDEIDLLIANYNGDVKALIKRLLDDRQMLIHQVEVAACAMSFGYGRGWKPKIPVK
ncbi:hypothetical protein [uncultured Bartonella sp.]|uniref:hypothetical protein n=1 Tax=uncultured Bartonella sp. TaxID=104108 RepID=UPI0026028AB0|nr:hypothetical protein [uncultured Bartonella sp.]